MSCFCEVAARAAEEEEAEAEAAAAMEKFLQPRGPLGLDSIAGGGVLFSIITRSSGQGLGLFGRQWRFLVVAFHLAFLVSRSFVVCNCLLCSAGAGFSYRLRTVRTCRREKQGSVA